MVFTSSFAASAAMVLVLAPLLCMAQGFNPTAAGLPPILQPTDVFEDLCVAFPTSPPSQPLPTELPRQFSVHVEANLLERNRTVWVHEFYDDVNNRGSITFIQGGVREQVIYDYDKEEVFLFPDTMRGTECSVFPLTESRTLNFTFGITRVNGSIHIGSTSAFLGLLVSDIPTQYMGPSNVRGTPALRWQACVTSGPFSFFADYYYTTTDSWTYATVGNPEEFDLTLTQIIVRGNGLVNDTVNNFYHVYSAFGYQSGPASVPERAFSVPTGTACVGRIRGLPVPEVPNFFSTYVQYVDSMSDTPQVITGREYYDFIHQLFRTDVYYNGGYGGDPGPYSIIHDFDSQLQYVINRHVSTCRITPLVNATIGDVTINSEGDAQLASPGRFIFLNTGLNFSYEGVSTVRGVEVDSWVAIVDSVSVPLNRVANFSNGIYEVFFTRPEYNISTDRSEGGTRIIWRANLRGMVAYSYMNVSGSSNVSYEIDYFDFSASEPPYDAFDISSCFDADQTHTVAFSFNVPRQGIDFGTFRTNFRASLVNATSLKPLQVNNIHIVSSNETTIFVAVHFTNLSDMARVSDEDVVVTADKALETLVSLADIGTPLPFQVDVSNGTKVSPVLFSANRGRRVGCNITCDDCPTSTTPTPGGTMPTPGGTMPTPGGTTPTPHIANITNRLRLSDGVVAGIAVALFCAGFILALLFMCFCCICVKFMRGKGSLPVSTVKYKKHDDELDNFS